MYIASLTNSAMTEWVYVFVNSIGEAMQVYPGYYLFSFIPYEHCSSF